MIDTYGDVTVEHGEDAVAVVEIHRPPANFFDIEVLRSLVTAYGAVDDQSTSRAIPALFRRQTLLRWVELPWV